MAKINKLLYNKRLSSVRSIYGLLLITLFILCWNISAYSVTWYRQSGGTETLTNQTFTSSITDTSGVFVTNKGVLTLTNSTVSTTGTTTSADSSSFYGLNAGVLANSSSTITLTGCNIKTTGTGANGVFATGKSTWIEMANDTVYCTGQLGHGVDATIAGTIILKDCILNTTNGSGATLATDRGGGTITATRGSMTTSGSKSPAIYSTGNITVTDATLKATGSEAAVIEGANSIALTNCSLAGEKSCGVMIYQSMSGDATGTDGTFTMIGGSFSALVGPLFYCNNSTAIISVSGVTLTSTQDTLIAAHYDHNNNWGTSGKNGGNIIFTADNETMSGEIYTDAISTISLTLKNNTSMTSHVNKAGLTMDATSIWNVTADSYITSFSDASSITSDSVTNIYGNGHCVYYDSTLSANSSLGNKTFYLRNGGYLTASVCNKTSVENNSIASPASLDCYPNPVNSTFNITTNSNLPQRVLIYNSLGIKVYDNNVTQNALIDAKSWGNGIYVVSMNGRYSRIVVTH